MEGLARLMKRGFEGVSRKFEGIDGKFKVVHQEIEKLATATANEFEAVRSEIRSEVSNLATKAELREVAHEIMQAIDRVDTHLSATATQWRDDHDEVRDTIKNHEGRLHTLEKRSS